MRRYRVEHRVEGERVEVSRLGCVLDQHDLEDVDREHCAVGDRGEIGVRSRERQSIASRVWWPATGLSEGQTRQLERNGTRLKELHEQIDTIKEQVSETIREQLGAGSSLEEAMCVTPPTQDRAEMGSRPASCWVVPFASLRRC